MKTVNVIEMLNSSFISSLAAFPDDKEGNEKAETLFRECCKVHKVEGDIDVFIEDGYAFANNYTVFLVHSTN